MVSSRAALRRLFYAGGAIATAAGLHTVVAGGRSVAGEGRANAAIESELRFYGAFYVAYGLTMLRVAPHADEDTDRVRALAGALLLAGVARAGGWLAAGRPHPVQQLLLGVELAAPPALVAWQARLG
jgi:hypothetical protein